MRVRCAWRRRPLRIHLRQVQLAVGKSEGEAAKTHIHLRSAQRGHAFHETPVSIWIVPTQARAHGYGDVDVGAPPMSPSRGQRRAAAKPPCRAAGADWPNQLVECAMHTLEQCVGRRGQPQCFQRPCSIALVHATDAALAHSALAKPFSSSLSLLCRASVRCSAAARIGHVYASSSHPRTMSPEVASRAQARTMAHCRTVGRGARTAA